LPNPGSLDALLGNEERHATFHEAVVTGVHIDFVRKRFVGEIQVCVGDPDASYVEDREQRRRGQLVVEGLTVWALEPPGENADGFGDGLWLTADGMLAEAPTSVGSVSPSCTQIDRRCGRCGTATMVVGPDGYFRLSCLSSSNARTALLLPLRVIDLILLYGLVMPCSGCAVPARSIQLLADNPILDGSSSRGMLRRSLTQSSRELSL